MEKNNKFLYDILMAIERIELFLKSSLVSRAQIHWEKQNNVEHFTIESSFITPT